MRFYLSIFSIALTFSALAQDYKKPDSKPFKQAKAERTLLDVQDTVKSIAFQLPETPGTVIINQDARIEDLAKRYDNMKHVQKGFRVQIFLGSREGQAKARSRFMNLYPQLASYLDYQAPNFKVRVGDFRKRVDAEKLLLEIRKDFPGAYIVPDEVELSKLP